MSVELSTVEFMSVGPIMVSFALADRDFGNALRNALSVRANGDVSVSSMDPKTSAKHIRECTYFVPLVSNSYASCRLAEAELKYAMTLEKKLFPLNFVGENWPPEDFAIQLSPIQYVCKYENCREWTQDQVELVAERISGQIKFLLANVSPLKKRVMISYRRCDAENHAIALKRSLLANGHDPESIFLDLDDIRVGDNWQDVLNSAVSTCTYFVCLVTSGYGGSLWTKRELELAYFSGKKIIPINFLNLWPPTRFVVQFSNNARKPHLSIVWPSKETPLLSVEQVALNVNKRIQVFNVI